MYLISNTNRNRVDTRKQMHQRLKPVLVTTNRAVIQLFTMYCSDNCK